MPVLLIMYLYLFGGMGLYFAVAALIRAIVQYFLGPQAGDKVWRVAAWLLIAAGVVLAIVWGAFLLVALLAVCVVIGVVFGTIWAIWWTGDTTLHIFATPWRRRFHRLRKEYFGRVTAQSGFDQRLRAMARRLQEHLDKMADLEEERRKSSYVPDYSFNRQEVRTLRRQFKLAYDTVRYFGFEVRGSDHTAYLSRRGLGAVDQPAA